MEQRDKIKESLRKMEEFAEKYDNILSADAIYNNISKIFENVSYHKKQQQLIDFLDNEKEL